MTRFASCLVVCLCTALAGCTPQIATGGEDSAYLASAPAPPESTAQKLLPLAVGNFWEMNGLSVTPGATAGSAPVERRWRDKLIITGTKTIRGKSGFLVEIQRNNSLWRQEVYRHTPSGLELLAFGEKQSDLLILEPPMPLVRSTVREGEEMAWKGKILFKANTYVATGYARLTSYENLQTKTGRFQCYRIDSVISMIRPKQRPLHFPAIRWLSERIGFVRRSFADAGRPAIQDLEKFKVQGE